jgi:hypothetical protein
VKTRKPCNIKNCKYYNSSYEFNCKYDRCIYTQEGKPKEGKLRDDLVLNLVDELSDDELLEFSEEIGIASINEEEPVDIRTFVLSPDYLDMGSQGTIWPENLKLLEDIFSGKFSEAYVIGGIGMGKSTIASIICLYTVYRILILKNPHSVYKMVANSPIEVVILSINETHAKDVLFTYALNLCENSQFFRKKEYAPNPDIKSRLQFPKNVSVVPLSGAKTSGIGRNVILGIMDEASWYPSTSMGDKATIQFQNLSRRIKSRFEKQGLPPGVFKGMIICISSPCNEEDFMEKSFREKEGRDHVFLKRMTTFESKPVGTFGPRSFNFCSTCRRIVNDEHVRKDHDIIVKNKHERDT